MLIFEHSAEGRKTKIQSTSGQVMPTDIPAALLRTTKPALPEVSEQQAVRHYTSLSQKNFSIDTHFYPQGSCTMKHKPRA